MPWYEGSSSGAAQGAMAGAAAGSVVPGWGTAIGAGIGGLVGYFGGGSNEPNKNAYDIEGYEERKRRLLEAFQQQSAFRDQQMQNLEMLRLQAANGDPLARMQLQQQTGRLMAMQQGMQAGATPGNQAMMARMASQNASRQQSGMAGQAAQADVTARLGAMQQLTGATQAAWGQDEEHNRLLAQMMQMELQQAMAQHGGSMSYDQTRSSRPSMLDYGLQAATTYGQLHGLGGGQQPKPTPPPTDPRASANYYTPPQ